MRRITQTLGIKRRVEGERDRYGNPVVSYAGPVEWPVYSVAPRVSSEPSEENRDPVIRGLTVHAPLDGPRPGSHDLVVHGGQDWDVVGDVGEWDKNPHVEETRHRGIVVNLDRTEG